MYDVDRKVNIFGLKITLILYSTGHLPLQSIRKSESVKKLYLHHTQKFRMHIGNVLRSSYIVFTKMEMY